MLTTQTHQSPDTSRGPRDVATVFLNALTARDFSTARSVLADDLTMRMLVPPGFMTDEGGDAAIGWFSSWFTDADPFHVEAASADEVEGRAAVVNRLRLRKPNGWYLIEQHLMLDFDADGRIAAIDLLCSGFRTIAADEPESKSERVHHYNAGDLGCGDGLAGQFRQQIQRIPIGHVLEVSTRDPAAKEDLPSLARLMGHLVVSIDASGDGRTLITVERGN
jgi:TusA-related sulfurtransferase